MSERTEITPIERDLATVYNLLCAAMANWDRADTDSELRERDRIYEEMKAVFQRYPGVLYHDHSRPQNPSYLGADDLRAALVEALDGWEGTWRSECETRSDPDPPARIAELRAKFLGSKA